MQRPRYLLAVLLTVVLTLLLPGVASAATTTYAVSGFEVYATTTRGVFTGQATDSITRQPAGVWGVTVDHDELTANTVARVNGGSFYLATTMNGASSFIAGQVTGGTVSSPPDGPCANQMYGVNVGLEVDGGGTGVFDGTLTHYRRSFFGRCILYAATVVGTLTLTL